MSTINTVPAKAAASTASLAISEKQGPTQDNSDLIGTPKQWKGRKTPWLREATNIFIAPFNMFAALPDYELEHQLSMHMDERVHNSLYKVLREAEAYRTACWRTAYWTVALSLVCTLGTALIGIGGAVLSFSDNVNASKVISILIAGFGVILSLLKGSGLPGTAFADYNNANDIIDRIEDVRMTRPPNWTEIENIKIAWRKIRDTGIERRGSIWSNSQMSTLATGRIPKSDGTAPTITTSPPQVPVLLSPPPVASTSTSLLPAAGTHTSTTATSRPLTTGPNLSTGPPATAGPVVTPAAPVAGTSSTTIAGITPTTTK